MINASKLVECCDKFHYMTGHYFYYGFDINPFGYHATVVVGDKAMTRHFKKEESDIFHDIYKFKELIWDMYAAIMIRDDCDIKEV